MNLELELSNLITLLRIPIDSVEDQGDRVKLLLVRTEIGFIPYFVEKDVIHFEVDDSVVNYLNWDYIFTENRAEIIAKIQGQLEFEEEDEINVVILNFRRVQVEDLSNRGSFYYFNCKLIDNEWDVILEND